MTRRGWLVILAALAAGCAALTGLGDPQPVRFGAAVVLLWLLPGAAWALSWPDRPPAERIILGLGLAFAVNGLMTLLLHLWPGPFPTDAARLLYLLAAIAPALIKRQTSNVIPFRENALPSPAPHPSPFILHPSAFLLPLLIAALVRLPNLGYSEFQGDEALIMRRAAQALAGDDGQLFLHQKGPVEVLTPMAVWALTGSINEAQARLSFALVGLLAVAAVMRLGARWFEPRAGALAGGLAAISGFLVAFARIVQYQNVVVAMGALGLLALTAYARQGRQRDLMLGAVFLAYGLLAHYDEVLFAPAALWLVGVGLAAQRAAWRRELGRLILAAVLGAAVLAVFYVPFVTNPNFAKTLDYLSGERVGSGGPLYDNTGRAWVMSTFYNSTYYVAGLLLLLGGGVLRFLFRAFNRPSALSASRFPLHVLRFTFYAALLYFAAPLIFYLFLVFDPRTHLYTFYPGAAVLAGAAASRAWEWARARRRGVALALAVAGAAWYGLCAAYIGLVFVNHAPEYKREWPASQSALYPTTFQDLPLFGFFGFPYRAGWKAVEGLYAQGVLTGTYASNEEPEITTWYVRSGARTLCNRPDLYIVAENVQDEVAIDRDELKRDYGLAARITVAGRPKLRIYKRGEAGAPAVTFAVEDFALAFDQGATVEAQLPSSYGGERRVDADFGQVARLLGYDLPGARVKQGEPLAVTLYWQALSPTVLNYQSFAHLVAGGQLVAQHDGAPACALRPTSGWEPGEIIRDEHLIPVGQDASPGPARLSVGMYDLITLERLPLAGAPDNVLDLAEIVITTNDR